MLEHRSAAGGIPTVYRAYFADQILIGIEETRTLAGAAQLGEYRFHGARLTHYAGAALGVPGEVTLQFDLDGRLVEASGRIEGRKSEVDPQTIDALRTRAQLLRSHALAQRAVREH